MESKFKTSFEKIAFNQARKLFLHGKIQAKKLQRLVDPHMDMSTLPKVYGESNKAMSAPGKFTGEQ